MRRYLVAAAVVALVIPALAAAKGPTGASISGPGLERTLTQRAADLPDTSYTATLLKDPPRIGEKVQEEAEEVVRAAREESDERVAEEAADVLYHLAVLLKSRGLSLADAEEVLIGRRR